MTEEFRPIKNYERYYVSNFGRVLNTKTGRFLSLRGCNNGYLIVQLWERGKGKDFLVHRLVAQTFIDNPLGLDTVDHINGIKTDNRVENLQWLSQHDNTSRFYREQATKEWKEHNRKVARELSKNLHELNQKPIVCIETGKIYRSAVQASKEFNVCRSNITQVCRGKRGQTHGLHFKYLLEDNDYE